jgi:hypothetical protein
MRDKVLIVLTATVTPSAFRDQTMLQDKQVRLGQYLQAIDFWLTYPDDRITGVVFCDNSGVASDLFANVSSKSGRAFEFLSFVDAACPEGVHYGYGELGIIDYVINNSDLVQKCGRIVKATGRLTFPTVNRLLDNIDAKCVFAIDCHHVKTRNIKYPFRSRTQIFYFQRDFYRNYFLGMRNEMIGHCSHIEEFLPRKLDVLDLPDDDIMFRWKCECVARGIGSNQNDYQSIGNVLRYSVRGLLRVLLPKLWL